jgi:type VI protein secretion system component Hcp
LENVVISSVQSARGGEAPTESITMNFEKSSISYSPASMERMETAPVVRPQITAPMPH